MVLVNSRYLHPVVALGHPHFVAYHSNLHQCPRHQGFAVYHSNPLRCYHLLMLDHSHLLLVSKALA